jgi:hypothetical protein
LLQIASEVFRIKKPAIVISEFLTKIAVPKNFKKECGGNLSNRPSRIMSRTGFGRVVSKNRLKSGDKFRMNTLFLSRVGRLFLTLLKNSVKLNEQHNFTHLKRINSDLKKIRLLYKKSKNFKKPNIY